MKFKDFLTKLKKDGKITQEKFDAAIESAPDWDFDNEAIEAFEAAFLTIDRAITDKSVNTRIRREALDGIDRDIHEFVDTGLRDFVHPDKIDLIKKNNNTYEKIKALSGLVSEAIKKNKAAPVTDEETKKELKKHKDTVQELMEKIESMNEESSKKEKHWQKEAEEKINGFRLDTELEKLANSIKFGKAFSDDKIRRDITKVKLNDIRNSNSLSLVEKDGQTVIQVMDKEGKPRFNGNSAVTINQLLEEEFKPYIKANNAGDDDEGEGQSQSQVTKRFKVPDVKPNIRQGSRTTVS